MLPNPSQDAQFAPGGSPLSPLYQTAALSFRRASSNRLQRVKELKLGVNGDRCCNMPPGKSNPEAVRPTDMSEHSIAVIVDFCQRLHIKFKAVNLNRLYKYTHLRFVSTHWLKRVLVLFHWSEKRMPAFILFAFLNVLRCRSRKPWNGSRRDCIGNVNVHQCC
jgi:hypothetical protein